VGHHGILHLNKIR